MLQVACECLEVSGCGQVCTSWAVATNCSTSMRWYGLHAPAAMLLENSEPWGFELGQDQDLWRPWRAIPGQFHRPVASVHWLWPPAAKQALMRVQRQAMFATAPPAVDCVA